MKYAERDRLFSDFLEAIPADIAERMLDEIEQRPDYTMVTKIADIDAHYRELDVAWRELYSSVCSFPSVPGDDI